MNHPFLVFPQMCGKGVRGTAGRQGGVCRHLASAGLRSPLPRLDIKSNAPTPSKDNTVALWSLSLATCTACAMLSHPALVAKAHWNGFVAVSNLAMNCLAMVLATKRLMTSPTTIPRTLPFGFCSAVVCPIRSGNAGLGERLSDFGLSDFVDHHRYPGEDADVLSSCR